MLILTQCIQICLYTIIANALIPFRIEAGDLTGLRKTVTRDFFWFQYPGMPRKKVAEVLRELPKDTNDPHSRITLICINEELEEDGDLQRLFKIKKDLIHLLSKASILSHLLLFEVIWNKDRLIIDWSSMIVKFTQEEINKAMQNLARTQDSETNDSTLALPADREYLMIDGEITTLMKTMMHYADTQSMAGYQGCPQFTRYGDFKVLYCFSEEFTPEVGALERYSLLFEQMLSTGKLDPEQAYMIKTRWKISPGQEEDVVRAVKKHTTDLQAIIKEDDRTLLLFREGYLISFKS